MSDGDGTRSLAAIVRGTAVALVGSLVGGGFGFLFTVVMARLLGKDEFGVLVLALNVITFGAALGVAGADFATVRYIAAATTPGRKRGAFVTPLVLALALDLGIAVLVAAFAGPIARDVVHAPALVEPLRALALVLPLTVAAQMLSAGLSGLELARGELARKVVEQGGRLVAGPVAVAAGLGVTGAILGLAGAAAAAALVLGYLLVRAMPRGGVTERVAAREVVGFAWPQAVANVAALWPVALSLVVSSFETSAQVALIGAAVAIAVLPALVYNAFSFRFSPTIARLWSEGRRDELRRLLTSVTRWVAMVSLPLYAVAIALPGPLLQVYGDAYRPAATALALVAAGNLLNALLGPVEWALIMTGHVRLELAANVAGVVALVASAVPLTAAFGIEGAAGSAIAYAATMNGLKLLFVRATVGMTTLSPGLLRPLGACALAAGGVALLEHVTGYGATIAGAAALAALLVALYAVVLVAVGIPDEDRAALRLALSR